MGCLLVEEMTNCSAIRLDRRIVYVTEGKLIIQAQKEDYNGANYTSARLRTINKGDWLYDRFEIRAKSPKGQGL